MADIQAFVGGNATALTVGAAGLLTAAAHIPVRGRALRDRWRGPGPEATAGVRVFPGARTGLAATDLMDLVADAPTGIDVVSVHVHAPSTGGEVAHRYRGHATQLGVDEGEWCAVLVGGAGGVTGADADAATADADAAPTAATDLLAFLTHRLGLLGLSARPLSRAEFAVAKATRPERLLARTPGRGHTRRPHVWFTVADDFELPDAPSQILGIGADGAAVVSSLPTLRHLRVTARRTSLADHVPNIFLPTLVTGARVGVRTHRPHHFTALLDHGALLVPSAGDATLDVLIRDGRHPVAVPPPAVRASAVVTLSDGHTNNPAEPPRPAGPTLTVGPLLWTLHDDRFPDLAPVRIRPLPGIVVERARAATRH